MADLISTDEMFYVSATPVHKGRFILYVEGIPAFTIKATGMPSSTTQQLEIWHINLRKQVAGKTVWNNISFTIQDYITPSGAQAAIEWLRMAHESITGRDGYPNMYKKDLTLLVLGPTGDKIREWTIKGAFPVNINWGDFDWATDDLNTIEVEMAIDYAVLNY